MSYQAIARKWRPETFDEIAGQTHVTQTLRNALSLRRIHHAFLFTGARGVGKTTAARAFARALNCTEGPTATPCGRCASCLEVPLGSSPDVTEIDGASNNSVDDVRALRDAVRYLPSRDRYRIYIIDEVHMLSIGAFNALLKTLEEPPPHVIFIFATTEVQKIPETILSRVQRFDFKRIPEKVVVGRLLTICQAEGVEIPEAGLRLIARAGEGSMRDAQSLLDQVIAFGGERVGVDDVARILGMVDRELLYGFLEGLLAGQPERGLDVIAQVYEYGYELSQFTAEVLELLRNAAMVVLSPGARRHLDVADEEQERLARVCDGVGVETFSRYFQVMLQVHDEVSRASRPRLVLEMAVARLAAVRPLQPVDHLLARLEDLERRLRGAGHPPPVGARQGTRSTEGPARRVAALPRDEDEVPTTLSAEPLLAEVPLTTEPVSTDRPSTDRPTAERSGLRSRPWPPPPPEDTPRPRPAPRAEDRSSRWAPPHGEELRTRPGPPAEPPTASEPVTLELPPPLPADADDLTRWRSLGRLLRTGNGATLVEHGAWVRRQDPALVLQAAPEYLRKVEGVARDPQVLRAVEHFFPGLTRVEVQPRAEGGPATAAEARRERRARHKEALEQEVAEDAAFRRAKETLGITQYDVIALSYPEDP